MSAGAGKVSSGTVTRTPTGVSHAKSGNPASASQKTVSSTKVMIMWLFVQLLPMLKDFNLLDIKAYKELIRVWLAYTLLEPLGPDFICRYKNKPNQQILLTFTQTEVYLRAYK